MTMVTIRLFNVTTWIPSASFNPERDYRIETATHILSRSQSPGFITELTVVEPGVGGASEPSPDPPFQQETPAAASSSSAP